MPRKPTKKERIARSARRAADILLTKETGFRSTIGGASKSPKGLPEPGFKTTDRQLGRLSTATLQQVGALRRKRHTAQFNRGAATFSLKQAERSLEFERSANRILAARRKKKTQRRGPTIGISGVR